MMSYLFELSPLEEAGASLVSDVGHKLQEAITEERKHRTLTKQEIATTLGVHRSHVHRLLSGHHNLTLVSLAELAYALGREVQINLPKIQNETGANFHHLDIYSDTDGSGAVVHDLRRNKKNNKEHSVMYEY